MNDKIIAAICVALVAAPAAYAAERCGRDSVQPTTGVDRSATPTSEVSASNARDGVCANDNARRNVTPTAAVSIRYGRDSAYVLNHPWPKQQAKLGDVAYKPGRP